VGSACFAVLLAGSIGQSIACALVNGEDCERLFGVKGKGAIRRQMSDEYNWLIWSVETKEWAMSDGERGRGPT
jgi:hypothetical protein